MKKAELKALEPKPHPPKRDELIAVRVNRRLKQALTRRAGRYQMTLSDYVTKIFIESLQGPL